ncbi:MAG: carboxypeptidase regulatory-like domain-containing protein, partial [Thermoanaerobaculia bacterium]
MLLSAAFSVLSLLVAGGAPAQSSGAFASGQLAIQGTRLSIAPGDEAQILDVAESVRVRTCFAGVCGSMAPGDSRVNGLLVKAELSGPELQAPATYTATPGGAFLLPGVQTEGTYLLSNIRLVRAAVQAGATEEVLGQATPAVVTLEVRRILATTATVRQLTLAELQARGIQITQQNFDAYSFAVGFAFQGGIVTIDFPVLFQDGGQVDLLAKPDVRLDDLSEELAAEVRRWQPPHIVPFRLEVGGSQGPVTKEELEDLPPETKLYGVIVLPGNVSFLHKFFDAQLLVANGAPAGSGAVLSNVTSTIRLPAAVPRELLRLAGTTPAVAPGQAVPVLGLTGETHLGPGEQGVASFTLEGVAAGTHVVTMEVAANLERPGRDILPLSGKLRAAIEVVDARFNLAFNHPDVVREDEAYTLFVTVTNVSARDWENAITLALDADRATGAVKADPGDSFQRRIETLGPGEGATVEFRLIAKVTGRCVATAFQASNAVQGVIRLRAGVGEHGIPLSPSSLVLPRFTELLPEPLVAANVPLLGLAYSLAVAPPGAIPTDLPRLVKSDVERRAVDLAEAGQRLFLGEERLPSLEALLLDQLGNRHVLPEFDQLRRTLEKGRTSAEGLASFLRQEQEVRSLAASELLGHFAGTMSYARPYLAATLESAGPGTAPTLEVRKLNGVTGVTYLAYAAGDPRALRSLSFGETYDVLDRPGGPRAPLAVVGRLSAEAGYSIVVHGAASGTTMPVTLSFVAPAPSGDGFVRVSFPPFAVPPRDAWAVDVVRAEADGRPLEYSLYHLATGTPVSGVPGADVLDVERPPFRLVGARQDFVLDPYGSGVWYLFNRPPARTDAETESHYEVQTDFRGLDTTSSGTILERTTVFSAASAVLQPSSERVVSVRFAQPVSAITSAHEGQPVISHEHRVDLSGLRDGWGDALGGPVPAIEVEPNHVGGLVEGRVLRGTGEAVAGAVVRLIRDRVVAMSGGVDAKVCHDLVAERVTDASGEFFFPFIEEPILGVPRPPEKGVVQSGFRIQAVAAAGPDPGSPEEGEEVTSTIRLQSRLARVNIAMLGRGTITGRILYEDSAPVPAAAVTAASTLFPEVRSTEANVDGTFRLEAMPVGPITITARDATGRSSYATVGLAAPGATADVTLRIQRAETPRTGTVSGRVFVRRESPEGPVTELASGASVAVYSAGAPFGQSTTGPGGAFLFEGIPAGHVTVQAADFSVSRTPAIVDTDLAPDATANVVLTLAAASPRSVSGQVLYRDPLAQVDVPVAGATVFVEGPGNYALTDETGTYRIDGVPAQGIGEPPYRVHAIDFVRKLEGTTAVSVTEASPDPVVAATIQLRGTAVGAIDGVVLDPLGLPAAGVKVTLLPIGETTSSADGTFSFEGVPARPYTVSAHKGDGLEAGAIGWIGAAGTEVLFGGHRAFATVRLRGAGTVHVKTRTANGPVRTPVFYRPTWFSPQELTIRQKASAIETTTDDNGSLTLVVPVGDLSVSGVSPFYGAASYRGAIDFAGQVKEVDLLFQPLSTVTGTVVDVDGVTPVAGVTIELRAHELPPQTMQTGSLGEFEFALVPTGPLALTASGFVGTIERTGRTYAAVTGPGQSLDVVVRLKAKGTVRGRVVEETAPGVRSPVAGAQVALQENDFPFRRLPAAPGYFAADATGRFAVSDVMAGRFTVVARHPGQVTRQGRLVGALNADFEVVEAGDVVLSGQVGDLTVLVRDAQTGSPVPDAQVTLSNGEATVAGADGRAQFVALPLGTWSVYAFHAPTGSGGRLADIHLDAAGQSLEVVVVLDQKGRVSGTLFDDEARTTPIGGGTVRLEGTVNGRLWGARVTALATTSREDGSLGKFAFDGLPVANYSLTAAIEGSDRRAEGTATLTPTAPEPEIVLILDAVREVYARAYQKEQARGLVEVNPDPAQGDGVFAVSYGRHWNVYTGEPIPIASRLLPDRPFPNHHFRFANVLAAKSFWIRAEESSGEHRRVLVTSASLASGSFGSGTEADPYKVVLKARGIVRATVRDAGGAAVAGATVRLHAANGTWESATDSAGRAAFSAVEEGTVSVSASIPGSPFGASASRVLEWDDQVLDIDLTLSPVVSAHGVVYEAPEDDSWDGDPSTLQPAEGVSVRIQPSAGDAQLLITGADGAFRFSGLAPGGYTIAAQSLDGSRIARASGTLGSEHGTDYLIPPLILDASRPRIVTLSPPNGASSVSRTAPVEILFSEPLHPSVLPSGPTSYFFHLTFGPSTAAGAWSSFIDEQGRQVVRFTPAPRYENSTTYSLRIEGGPSGVRDREGRPLTDSGDIGASFTTSDTDGPRVVGTVPLLARPVDPESPIRIDFGEVLVLTPAQLQASILFEWKSTGGAWAVHPVTVSLTRGGYSILVDQPSGVTFTDDSLRRRLTVSGLTDASGNPMPAWIGEYRIYDENPPVLTIGLPPNAPTGDLSASASYTLSPSFTAPDDVTPENPFGDVDRVEYTFGSSLDPTQPASSPGAVLTTAPFAFGFVASYVGDGETPRPFPVWVKAFDTSGNPSEQLRLDMRVLPNTPPVVSEVTVSATAPVAGITYAGSTLSATAGGLADGDDARLTVSAELRRGTADSSELVSSAPARSVDRPAEGWGALPAQVFSLVLPITEPEGTAFFVRVRAVDSKGVAGTADAAFAVADDAIDPAVSGLVARRPDGDAATSFVIGETFVLEVTVHDSETGVKGLVVTTSGGTLPPTLVATRVGTTDLFRTESVTVPATLTEPVHVVVTATAEDFGGNDDVGTLELDLAPSSDPTMPVIEWLSPFEGGLWPASYVSVDPGKAGVDLLLRLRVTDRDLDGSGNEVPGSVANVRFRGPVDASGTLSSDWTVAAALPGAMAGEWIYEGVWRVPNGVVPGTALSFEAEAVDAGANQTTKTVTLQAVAARYVYEAATTSVGSGSEIPAPAGDEALPIFLLDGTTLSLYPKNGGGPRSYASLHLYSGGTLSAGAGSPVSVRRTTLTSPEVTSYESLVPYYPLELSIGETLGVAHGAAIDVTGRGLLGGDATHSPVALPGERASLAGAGGSHGGMGRPPQGEWLARLGDPGSVYGNVREPRLPGGGGGNWGATGGGVVRIEAPSATVRLHGDLLADGGPVPGGGSVGAAGGSIRLRAGRLEGRGEARASGSFVAAGIYRPSGSGGRVSLSWVEPTIAGVAARADGATSLVSSGSGSPGIPPLAGAGTVFLERIDATRLPLDRGTLRISNPASTDPPAWTRLPGLGNAVVTGVDSASKELIVAAPAAAGSIEGERIVVTIPAPAGGNPTILVLAVTAQSRSVGSVGAADQSFRLAVVASDAELAQVASAVSGGTAVSARARLSYAAFEARGMARVVSSDELEVAGVVDDRAAMTLDPSARVLLGGDEPTVSFEGTSPAPGANVTQGTAIDVRFRVADFLGLSTIEETWTGAGTTATRTFSEPLEAFSEPMPTRVTVPASQPAGPVTYRVRATDRAGRATVSEATWNVVGDATNPVITAIELSPVRTGDVYAAGDTITIRAYASDDVKLARIQVSVDGVTIESATSPATLVWLVPPVTTSSAFEVSVEATDLTGNRATGTRLITVMPRVDTVPPTVAIDCPSSGAILPSGYGNFILQSTASDDLGVQRVEVYREGETTPFATAYATSGSVKTYASSTPAITLPSVSEPTLVRFRVRAFDFGGNTSEEAATEVMVVPAVRLLAMGPNDWSALSNQVAYLDEGTLVLDQPRTLGGFLVLRGASVTQASGGSKSVDLTVAGPVYVDCGGSIDVSGRGYPADATYPGATPGTNAAGSHLGVGGLQGGGALAGTYGSVTRPQEAGSGGFGSYAQPGGGVIRIEAGSVVLGGANAAILANGGGNHSNVGAGGSVWIK